MGNLEESSFTGNFESWKGLWGRGIALSRGSVKEASGRALLLGNLKDEVLEICKMPCKQASLSIGALLGNLKWVCLLGLLREMNSIPGYFLGPGGYSDFKSK
jgi:hypothetical protein